MIVTAAQAVVVYLDGISHKEESNAYTSRELSLHGCVTAPSYEELRGITVKFGFFDHLAGSKNGWKDEAVLLPPGDTDG